MNNVYENNMKIHPLLPFFEKNKKILISILISIIIVISYFVINNQLTNKKNVEASNIYTSFLEELSSDDPDLDLINQDLNSLLEAYGSSGYTQIALLNKASFDASNNNFEESLNNFQKLVKITDGYKGNKIYNKIDFTHPYYDEKALKNQSKLNSIQNINNTLFTGSYFGYGFHEDGIKSSIEMLKTLND